MDWIVSYIDCRKCGNHIMCEYHKGLLKKELKDKQLKQAPTPKCVGCEEIA